MTFEKCMMSVKTTLKKRGFDNPEEIAAGMCSMWAQENGVEREFAETTKEPTRRSFALSVGEGDDTTRTYQRSKTIDIFQIIFLIFWIFSIFSPEIFFIALRCLLTSAKAG